jgi:hypothetical protein
MNPLNKPFHEMTDEELVEAHTLWQWRVFTAAGFSSAKFSASMLKQIAFEGAKRGFKFSNPYPIVRG